MSAPPPRRPFLEKINNHFILLDQRIVQEISKGGIKKEQRP
jgi:hypothetical protein